MGVVEVEMQFPVALVYTLPKVMEGFQGQRSILSVIAQNKDWEIEGTRYKLGPDTGYSDVYVIISEIPGIIVSNR
jgi:hypothetical protein